MSVIDKVQHYQRSIEKCWDDEERMMHCISKLYQLPITVQHLRDTGVGRTVNSLRKYDGGVGDAAKALVAKWKTMVANEDSSDAEDEDEACVPDAPESYSDTPESPKRDGNPENGLSRSQESKERHKKSSKSSSSHGSKHSPKGNLETDSKSREKHSSKEKQKNSKEEEQRDKSRKHTKHDSDSDSRKSSKDDSKRDSRDKREDVKVSSSTESVVTNGNDSRKRKQERGEKESKKAKYSESESEEDTSRLVINSPSESESIGIELGSLESETKKSTQLCDKSSRKEGHKDRKKDKDREKDDSKKSRSEEKESQKKDSKKDDKRKKESHKHSSKSKSSHSSSKSSSKDSSKHSDMPEEEKSKREDKSRSEGKDKERDKDKDQKVKKKIKKEKDEDVVGIDSQSGTSFADALGMCMLPPPSRKKGGNPPSTTGKSSKAEPEASTSESKSVPFLAKFKTEDADLESNPPSLLAPNVKLEPLSVDLAATLPEISPNYKPLTYNMNPVNRKIEEDRSLSEVIYSKNQRTKVFSGNKTGYSTVPSLYEMCIRVLIENIDALEVTGGVPFYILKPVLERATPDQLYMLEHHNPYLVEETDPLWQFHCNREFRTKKREEMESWREMYMRCLDEREAKLKALTANIKQSIDKSTPVRSTIQVNDNFHVKPPRSVLRKQAKYGTAKDLPVTSSELKRKLISGVSKPVATTNSCSPSPIPRLKATSSSIGKKTKAPLMAKALQLIKGRYRR